MGITGLIPFMEKASRHVNISQFGGMCVAIDSYCWLHKGAYTCADKLARGEPCTAYVSYCMKYVDMLLSLNIKPILVFDGRHLPAKAGTEKKRRESRDLSRKKAAELLRAGQKEEARSFLRRCVDVTHEMALSLIQECRRRNVDCIVAPYEADAELAYLNVKNIAQVVITEDSDLVLFGCTKIMFKMDMAGNGVLVESERLHLAMGVRPENFSFDKFRYMCILSGCDYLPSLPGIGLSKACKFVTKSSDPDIHKSLTRLPLFLNMKLQMTVEYRDEFLRADATFRYQLVYDPILRKQMTLNPTPHGYKPVGCTGKPLDEDLAYQLALGNVDPFTLNAMDSFDPDNPKPIPGGKTSSWKTPSKALHPSIWTRGFQVHPVGPPPDPRQVERPTTRGKVVSIFPKRPASMEEGIPSEAELTSIYSHFTPSAKRPCIESLNPEEIMEELAEESPAKRMAPRTMVKSPIIGGARRNPFASPPDAPTMVRPRKNFSALEIFSQLKTCPKAGPAVQSRYFNTARTGSEPVDVKAGDEDALKDISNSVINADTFEMESPTRVNETPAVEKTQSTNNDGDPKTIQKNMLQTFKWASLNKVCYPSTLGTSSSCGDFKSPWKKPDDTVISVSDERRTRLEEEDVDEPNTVDEGFVSQTPPAVKPVHSKLPVLAKACRQTGLSKVSAKNGGAKSQQTLLSMFGFQGNGNKMKRK